MDVKKNATNEAISLNVERKMLASQEVVLELSSKELFGDTQGILISHLGERYLLTITKQKKLLLTKFKHYLAQ